MGDLFPPAAPGDGIPAIPGLTYLPEYITAAEEQRLVGAIDRRPWDTQWQRRRQPYGGGYGSAAQVAPIPPWGRRLADRMFAEGLTRRPFDHVLVNEYLPGQGIASHRDYAPYGRTVVSLSLLSPCVMSFRRRRDGRRAEMLLEPRSLLVLSDAARYDWEHGIAARKSDVWNGERIRRGRRVSVTFRFLDADP